MFCNSLGNDEKFAKFAAWILMRTWLVFENVRHFSGNNEISIKTLKMHHGWKGACTAAFQENPCARMKGMHVCKDLRAPLSSPLFKRILVREYEKCLRPMVVKDPCHRHFYRDSSCENKKNKNSKQKKTRNDPNPQQETTTTKGTVWRAYVLLAFKGDVFKMYENPCARTRKKSRTRSTWLNNNYL